MIRGNWRLPRRAGLWPAILAGAAALWFTAGAAGAQPVAPGPAASGSAVFAPVAAAAAKLERPVGTSGSARPAESRDALFWAYDFVEHDYYRLRATLVHASDVSRVYVEAGQPVAASAVRSIAESFEDQIYPKLRNRLGHEPEPGVDGQRAITLLLLDVQDPFGHGLAPHTYYAGYFDPTNQYLQSQLDGDPALAGRRSNELEMVYLDVAPTVPGSHAQHQTLAHEFAHLITWNYDVDEAAWLSEGLSELAVFIAGLGHPAEHVMAYLTEPDASLVTWNGADRDYGMSYLFLLYLYEQAERAARAGSVEAAAWPRRLVEHSGNGIATVSDTLPLDRPLAEVFRDWAVALQLDDTALSDGRYGFASLELGQGRADDIHFPTLAVQTRGTFPIQDAALQMAPWSIRGDRLVAGPGDVDVTLSPSAPICAAVIGMPTYQHSPPGTADVRAGCSQLPIPALGWTISGFQTGGTVAAVHAVTANASSQPVRVSLSALPPVGGLQWRPPVHLPLAVR